VKPAKSCRKIAEWEDHDTEPGGDAGFLLAAIDVTLGYPCYARVSWSELTDEEFDALDRGEGIEPLCLCGKNCR
jgi:hypothetical protein